MNTFLSRLFIGIALLVVPIGMIAGPPWLTLLFGLVVPSLGLWELYAAFAKKGIHADFPGAVCASILFQWAAYCGKTDWMLFVLFAYVMALLIRLTFGFIAKAEDLFTGLFGLLYISGFFSFLTRMALENQQLILLVFLASWGCDTSAYCVGTLFGRHKLMPRVTPKKTVEGAIGGVLGSVLLTRLLLLLFSTEAWIKPLLYVGVGAVFSQLGDLCASQFKRHVGIKDYSHLFGAHGGILDRFDSVLFAAPVLWLLVHIG